MTDSGFEDARRRAQAWTATLPDTWRSALIGGLGTLLAILLAFSIDALWDYTSDRARERTYLDALKAELQATREGIGRHRAGIDRRTQTIKHYLSTVALVQAAAPSIDTIYAMVGALGPYREIVPRRAALDDLLSSGGLQLIRSDTLRRSLAAYDEALSQDQAVQQAILGLWNTQLSPYDVAHANLSIMAADSGANMQALRAFQPDANAFYGSRTYSNLLFSRSVHEGRVRAAHDQVLQMIDVLLDLLGSPQ